MSAWENARHDNPYAEHDATKECEWFLRCHEQSIGIIEHPTLGDVEICRGHYEWLTTPFSPTKMVPPIAARTANAHWV